MCVGISQDGKFDPEVKLFFGYVCWLWQRAKMLEVGQDPRKTPIDACNINKSLEDGVKSEIIGKDFIGGCLPALYQQLPDLDVAHPFRAGVKPPSYKKVGNISISFHFVADGSF